MRMPAEWAPHERTLMAWPARADMWGAHFEQAKRDHAEIANAIAAFEPVLLAADPAQADEARAACAEGVEVVPIALDDSWARDSGPIFVSDAAGARRAGVDFIFNGWGEKFRPYDDDAAFAARVLDHLGEERRRAELVLEGGSIAVDGEGLLVTTEQCLLHPSRNPSLSRDEIEARLKAHLGAERIVWLGSGLVEDHDTDGHVDNIAAFVAPGRVLAQTVADEANPEPRDPAGERGRGCATRAWTWWSCRCCRTWSTTARPPSCPYLNFYVCNGAVIVPVSGAPPTPRPSPRSARCSPAAR
jgi:agmatine deiminase